MTTDRPLRFNAVGPVLEFALLIVPVVMNGFFVVYALTGWILEGRDKLNWSLEAESVSVYVGASVVIWSLVVSAYTRLRGGSRTHPLILSGWVHIVIAVLLVTSVFATVRL